MQVPPGRSRAHPVAALVLVGVWLALVVPALVAMPARTAAQASGTLTLLQASVDALARPPSTDWQVVLADADCVCSSDIETELVAALGADAVLRAASDAGLPPLTLLAPDGRIAYAGGYRVPLGCGGNGVDVVTRLKSGGFDADMAVIDPTARCRCP